MTGQEFAQCLIDQFELVDVGLEATKPGTDHYDPSSKYVRIGEDYYTKHSLTAIAVAAHEVGHALQDATHYPGMRLRTKLARFAVVAGQLGNGALIAAPIMMAIAKSPAMGGIIFGLALLGFSMTILMHLVTLPVEFDASFNRALPILKDCHYLSPTDLTKARRILTACAMTYVAQSLMSILQFQRWFKFLRR